MPGYGYAKVPEAVRRKWQGLLERYLAERPNLVGLVLIMDVRHPLKELDVRMMEWFLPSGRPIHVLLTKSDKLSRGQAAATLQTVRRALREKMPAGQVSVQLFSSLERSGVEEVERTVSGWLLPEQSAPDAGTAAFDGGNAK